MVSLFHRATINYATVTYARTAEELTAIGHDRSVDGVVTARVPVSHRLVERHFHHSLARHRRPVRIVLVQVYG